MNRKFCILASFSGEGGVERNMIKLIKGFLRKGLRFELLTVKEKGNFFKELPEGVKKIKLPFNQSLLNIPYLINYLKKNRPYSIFSAKDRANRASIVSKLLSRVRVKTVIRLGTNLSASLSDNSPVKRWFRYLPSRMLYPKCDEIIAVSKGVAEDINKITHIPVERIHIIPNPVIDEEIYKKAEEEVTEEWFGRKDRPVILGIGRLTKQKDFATAIKAIKKLKESGFKVRYAILGEGSKRKELEELIERLRLKDSVKILGFKRNPYKYIKKSDLFLLSSRWEGSPNAMVEALALGIPVVSTNCPSGPEEILKNRICPLVRIGDFVEMAEAIVKVLKNPPPEALLKKSVEEFTLEKSVNRYLNVILN